MWLSIFSGSEGLAAPPESGSRRRVYGVLAEFAEPTALVVALRRALSEGYRDVDTFAPLPIEEITELLSPDGSRLPKIVLVGGITGAIVGYFLQAYSAIVDYPLNVGGRPLHSWPMFIPITFELTVLFAGVFAVLGLFGVCNLPKPYHPVFSAKRFTLASQDRYFLLIKAADPRFDIDKARAFVESLSPYEVTLVEM